MICYDIMEANNIMEALDSSLEFPIGAKFYFQGNLFEIVESKEEIWGCPECAFSKRGEDVLCDFVKCTGGSRHDNKVTCFRKVTEAKENNNG